MYRLEPSLLFTTWMALMLNWLLTTTTSLADMTLMEPGEILLKTQSVTESLSVWLMVRPGRGKWVKLLWWRISSFTLVVVI